MLKTVPGHYSKRAPCSRPFLVTALHCTVLETVPGYSSKRALCSKPPMVTSLNVRYARDRPSLLGSMCAWLKTVPVYYLHVPLTPGRSLFLSPPDGLFSPNKSIFFTHKIPSVHAFWNLEEYPRPSLDIEVLSYLTGFNIGKRGTVLCNQYLDTFVSEDLNFQPDDNCVTPVGQAPTDRTVSNFCYGNVTPDMQQHPTTHYL